MTCEAIALHSDGVNDCFHRLGDLMISITNFGKASHNSCFGVVLQCIDRDAVMVQRDAWLMCLFGPDCWSAVASCVLYD